MNCPSCHQSLDGQTFEGNYGKSVSLDLCHTCHAVWFDSYENLHLSPQGILHLFRIIHEKQAERRSPLPENISCPRCQIRLVRVSDRQRNTRFHYFECGQGHGRFITFFQFLREKNFVRSLDPKEMAELKKHIVTLNCSNCGAVVDIDKASTCTYCRTPISMLDPRQIEHTLQTLQHAENKRQTVGPLLRPALVIEQLKAEAESRRHHEQLSGMPDPLLLQETFELVEGGISVLLEAFQDQF